jgi:hypothetical protein
MEEWFHNSNNKVEVDNVKPLFGKVLQTLQALFPREDKTNGFCIPKMHGMKKIQAYMKRYGRAINFYGGPGEAAHKFFVKVPGQKTHRVSKYAVQTANQCYDIMVTKHAMRSIGIEMDQVVVQRKKIDIDPSDVVKETNDLSVTFRGKCRLVVTNDILESMKANDNVYVTWLCDKKNIKRNNNKLCLNKDLVKVLLRKISDIGDTNCIKDITVMVPEQPLIWMTVAR